MPLIMPYRKLDPIPASGMALCQYECVVRWDISNATEIVVAASTLLV